MCFPFDERVMSENDECVMMNGCEPHDECALVIDVCCQDSFDVR